MVMDWFDISLSAVKKYKELVMTTEMMMNEAIRMTFLETDLDFSEREGRYKESPAKIRHDRRKDKKPILDPAMNSM